MTHAAAHPWDLPEDPKSLAEVRAISHVRALADLFGRRPDLAGVYPPADLPGTG